MFSGLLKIERKIRSGFLRTEDCIHVDSIHSMIGNCSGALAQSIGCPSKPLKVGSYPARLEFKAQYESKGEQSRTRLIVTSSCQKMDGTICVSKGHEETSWRYRHRADIRGHVELNPILSMRDIVFHWKNLPGRTRYRCSD